MGSESLTIDLILSGFLIFVRVGGVVMTAPFFNNTSFPMQVRLYFAIVVSILLFFFNTFVFQYFVFLNTFVP